jgi:hypothetical protein
MIIFVTIKKYKLKNIFDSSMEVLLIITPWFKVLYNLIPPNKMDNNTLNRIKFNMNFYL